MMKKVSMFVLVCLVLSGCVASLYTKQVQVNKDANGKIISTTETETIQQQGSTEGLKFKNLKVAE